MHVESLEQGMARVEACGGEVMPDTRTTFPLGEGQRAEVVVCTDPDGQWIELIELQRG